MLTERALAAMDRDQLLRYVGTLHEALGHVLGAASEAQKYVQRSVVAGMVGWRQAGSK